MTTSISTPRNLALWILTFVIALNATPIAQAGHEHDHQFVTITEYLGYDSDSEISKVIVSTGSESYLITMHGRLRALETRSGSKGRISVTSNGRWTHFAVSGYEGVLRIHTAQRRS